MGLFGRKPQPEALTESLKVSSAQPEAETTTDLETSLNAKLAKLEEVNTQRNALGRLEEEVGELGQITIGAPENVIAQKKAEINDLAQRIQEGEKALKALLPEATLIVEDGQTVAIINDKKYLGPRTSTAPIRIAGAEPEQGGVELASGDIPRHIIDIDPAPTPTNRRVVPDVSAQKTVN